MHIKKTINFYTAFFALICLTACGRGRDNSTRRIAIESISQSAGSDYLYYTKKTQADSEFKDMIVRYDPNMREEHVLIRAESYDGGGVADYAATDGFIVFTIFEQKDSMGNGQKLYIFSFDEAETILQSRTDRRYQPSR